MWVVSLDLDQNDFPFSEFVLTAMIKPGTGSWVSLTQKSHRQQWGKAGNIRKKEGSAVFCYCCVSSFHQTRIDRGCIGRAKHCPLHPFLGCHAFYFSSFCPIHWLDRYPIQCLRAPFLHRCHRCLHTAPAQWPSLQVKRMTSVSHRASVQVGGSFCITEQVRLCLGDRLLCRALSVYLD